MPWTKTNYPASMKNLPEAVRTKAIEIANALLKNKNSEDGIALTIATAISQAKEWAVSYGIHSESGRSFSAETKNRRGDNTTPDDKWESRPTITAQGKHGKIEKRESFNLVRKTPKRQ